MRKAKSIRLAWAALIAVAGWLALAGAASGAEQPGGGVTPLSEVKEPVFTAPGGPARWGSDPFSPPEEPRKEEPPPKRDVFTDTVKEMRVSAIMRGKGTDAAIINGYIVHPGDRIRDFVVARIEPDKVVLTAQSKEYAITLDPLVPGLVPVKNGE